MYKIGIAGYGYVGKAMHKMFGQWVTEIYDPLHQPVKTDFSNVDLLVVSVPTEMKEDGGCDTSIVEKTIKNTNAPLILIKSTVIPGTTDDLVKKYKKRIVFSPEYIGEGKYFTPPWKYPDPTNPLSHGFVILGGKEKDCEEVAHILVRRMGPHTKIHIMTAKEAEVVKYWENIWGAMKVTFTNVMFDCLESLGINFYRAREGWAADPRVEKMHTAVFKDARGFSGKCYPKDLRAFIKKVEDSGYDPKLLKEVWNTNCDYRPKEFKKIK